MTNNTSKKATPKKKAAPKDGTEELAARFMTIGYWLDVASRAADLSEQLLEEAADLATQLEHALEEGELDLYSDLVCNLSDAKQDLANAAREVQRVANSAAAFADATATRVLASS